MFQHGLSRRKQSCLDLELLAEPRVNCSKSLVDTIYEATIRSKTAGQQRSKTLNPGLQFYGVSKSNHLQLQSAKYGVSTIPKMDDLGGTPKWETSL